MEALQAVGSAESQAPAPCPTTRQHHAQPPDQVGFTAALPEPQTLFARGAALGHGWISGAPLAHDSTSTSGRHANGLGAGLRPGAFDDGSVREGLIGDKVHCVVQLAAGSAAAMQLTTGHTPESRTRSGSDAEDSSTIVGSEVAEPAAAAAAAAASALTSAPLVVLADNQSAITLTSQLQLLRHSQQIASVVQQKQQQQQTPPRDSITVGCDGTSSASQHTASPSPQAAITDSGAAVAAAGGTSGHRTPRVCSSGGRREFAQQQLQSEKALNGCGRRSQKRGKAYRHHCGASDDEEEDAEELVLEVQSDDIVRTVASSSEEEAADAEEDGEGTAEAYTEVDGDDDDDGNDGGVDGEQPEEHMHGCPRCCSATAGCGTCPACPLVSWPLAQWMPEEARLQEGVPNAPVFYPNPEEFAEDPLSYIAKIRPEAEKYGICRVVPPASCWDPPFLLDSGGGDGGREWFRFETRRQFISHLCMRPCGGPAEVAPDQGLTQKGVRQQEHWAAAGPCHDQQGPDVCIHSMGFQGRTKAHDHHHHHNYHHLWVTKPNLQAAHQHQHHHIQVQQEQQQHGRQDQQHAQQARCMMPQQQQQGQQQQEQPGERQELEPPMQCEPHRLQHNQRRQNKQQKHQATPVALAATASSTGADAGVATGFCGASSGSRPSNTTTTHRGVRLVAPDNSPCPRPPGAAVESSLERYITGLGAHPLLGHDTAAATAAAAALSAAGRGQGAAVAASPLSRAWAGSRMVSVGRRASQHSARAAATAGAACRNGSRPGSDSESSGGGGGESSPRTHTLRSFEAYCHWARSLYFGLPPFDDRQGGTLTRERASSCPALSSIPETASSGECVDANAGAAAAAAVAALPPRLADAVAHDAAGSEPSLEEIEAEFWRIVERPTGNVVVEALYGDDLDSVRHGSGFPLPPWRAPSTDMRAQSATAAAPSPPLDEHTRRYACHPWSINNLPRASGSMLRYMEMKELITGVMAPWLCIGSCLSASCWRSEDHALYSINYLHVGAPKVWYGVPAHAAEQFEAAMRDAVPHLFAEDPLLLHRPITHMSPSELRRRGVPVYRLVHEPGSFVITFPNAYHAGFNAGFNCAEAVNFAPADWLPFGSAAVRKYRAQGRRNTFSHDCLLVRLVSAASEVSAARHAAALPHLLRPSPLPAANLPSPPPQQQQISGAVQVRVDPVDQYNASEILAEEGTLSAVKSESAATAGAVIHASTAAAVPAAATVTGSGDNDGFQLWKSWQAGVRLAEVPPAAVCTAVGELALRLEDEARRRSVAREFGVTKERPMSGEGCAKDEEGVHTCTADTGCTLCKCDLFLSAVISPQRPGLATCPEHASSLGVLPEDCVLAIRHSLDELHTLVATALELFPEGNGAIAEARARRASAPRSAIRRLGPISKYGLPYAAPRDEQDARDAASEDVCAVAGPLTDDPYMPYDPEAVDAAAANDAGVETGGVRLGTEANAAALQAAILVAIKAEPKATLEQRESSTHAATTAPTVATAAIPPSVVDAPLPIAPPPPTAAAAAASGEREGLGPRHVLLLEEQQAEAQRREEQRQAQETMRLARSQRAARRSTVAAGAGGGGGALGQATSPPPPPPPALPRPLTTPLQPTQSAVLCVPAVAVITPVSTAPPWQPVLTSGDAPVETLASRSLPSPVPPVSPATVGATAVPVGPTASVRAAQQEAVAAAEAAAAPPPSHSVAMVMPQVAHQGAAASAARVSEQAPPAGGTKRSSRGASGQASAQLALVEGDRAVRPRRERRVPKHLLDAEMELAEEMQQVVAAAVAASALPPPSPTAPASPAATSPGVPANTAAARAHELQLPQPQPPVASTLNPSSPYDEEPQPQQAAALPLLSPADGGGRAVLKPLFASGVHFNPALLAANLVVAMLSAAAHGAVPRVEGPSVPKAMFPPTEQQQREQQDQQKEAHQLSQPSELQLPQPPPQQQHDQHAHGPDAACSYQQQQQLHGIQLRGQDLQELPQQPQLSSPPQAVQQHQQQQQQLDAQHQGTAPCDQGVGFQAEPLPCAVSTTAPPPQPPAQADEVYVSPRRSSRPTRPSIRLLSAAGGSGSGGPGGGLPAPATATTATLTAATTSSAPTSPPGAAPGVLLLRRETTSGPSTRMRGAHAAARRASAGPSAGAPGSLPPTSIPDHGAPAAAGSGGSDAIPVGAVAMQPTVTAGASTLSLGLGAAAAVKASNGKATAAQRTAGAATGFGDGGDRDRTRRHARAAGGGAAKTAACVGGAPPTPRKKEAVTTQSRLGSSSTEGLHGLQSHRVPTDSTGPGDSSASLRALLPCVPPPLELAHSAPSPLQVPQSQAAPEPTIEPGPQQQRKQQQLAQGHAAPLQLQPQPPAAPTPPSQNPAAVQSAAGRPVRKRKTALSNDMVIYGESAALFGAQVPLKRKFSSDRRGAATTASGSGSDAAASAGAGAGTGSSAADARPAAGSEEDAAVAELEDTHDSLATFAVEDLRPLAISMSPPHPIFGDLHREMTPSSPPMALPLPLASGVELRLRLPARAADVNAVGASMAAAGAADAVDASAMGLMEGDIGMDGVAGSAVPHSPPGFLGLHDDDPGREHDDHDVFMVDASGRALALSTSPSVNGLDSLTAMMLPPPCGDSPRVAAEYDGLVHAPEAAAAAAPYANFTAAAATAAASDMLLPPLQPQLLLGITMDPSCAQGYPAADTPSAVASGLTFGRDQRSGGGDEGAGGVAADGATTVQMALKRLADSQTGQAHGVGVGPGFANTTAKAGAGAGAPSARFPAWEEKNYGVIAEFVYAGAASDAAYFEDSRQGLSSLVAGAAGEWADLDDIVML